jgi:hypothetical protein
MRHFSFCRQKEIPRFFVKPKRSIPYWQQSAKPDEASQILDTLFLYGPVDLQSSVLHWGFVPKLCMFFSSIKFLQQLTSWCKVCCLFKNSTISRQSYSEPHEFNARFTSYLLRSLLISCYFHLYIYIYIYIYDPPNAGKELYQTSQFYIQLRNAVLSPHEMVSR